MALNVLFIFLSVVYVARNPRDCCVSYYHHQTLFDEGYRFTGEFEDFARLFREGLLNYGDYWSHLKVRSCLVL